MDNEETILDEELDTDTEDIEDVEEDATVDDDSDDEFEYDEDGNIIIPEVEFDEEGEEEGDTVEEKDETEDSEENEDSEEAEEIVEPDDAQSEKDARIAQLESELRKLEAQGKETLSKLGVKSDDVMEGLVSLAAEADGITPKEYLRQKASAERDEQARALLRQQEFEKIATSDLAELHAAYPETKGYKHIKELPDDIKKKFAHFREVGLSAKEAYAAANPDGIRTNVATAVKKQSLHESKSHLRTTVPKGSKDNSIVMPKSALAQWRDIFPNKTDKEIIALYKQTSK